MLGPMAHALKAISAAARRYGSTEFRAYSKDCERALLAKLQRIYQEQGIALYLGAGVSASARLPDWNGLIRALLGGVINTRAFGEENPPPPRGEGTDSSPWPYKTFERT